LRIAWADIHQVGNLAFLKLGAFITFKLKGVEEGTGPIRAIVLDTLTGISSLCLILTIVGLPKRLVLDGLCRERPGWCRPLLRGPCTEDCACARELRGVRECASPKRLLLEVLRFQLAPQTRPSARNGLRMVWRSHRVSESSFGQLASLLGLDNLPTVSPYRPVMVSLVGQSVPLGSGDLSYSITSMQ